MPEVSVVVPTYNRAEVIPRALDSVLDQTFDDFELIVVDDGSTDHTCSVLDRYRDPRITTVSHSTNQGGSAARNTGIRMTSGEKIAFLDSDDYWHPTKLEKQVGELESLPDDWIATYCGTHHISNRELRGVTKGPFEDRLSGLIERLRSRLESGDRDYHIPDKGGEDLIPYVLSGEFELGGASTLLVDRDAVTQVGGFDERFPRHQDWEFLIRLLKVGNLSYVDERLVTKYGWAAPDIETIVRAKKLYIDTFDEDINRYEEEGYEIVARHNYELALLSLRAGELTEALPYFRRSNLTGMDALEVLIAMYIGIRRTCTSR
ncbi:glycosyltransferase family 2 protein [Natrialbaceae archaeon GCM10025810]|uniref:glycosyltransferase family 2 protein n=1 Tax=Halovalidus salilacus TaxID=3075124 RepID=UPI003605C579